MGKRSWPPPETACGVVNTNLLRDPFEAGPRDRRVPPPFCASATRQTLKPSAVAACPFHSVVAREVVVPRLAQGCARPPTQQALLAEAR